MAKTAHEQWQLHRKRLAEARRAEAKAFAAVHQSFKSTGGVVAGPTSTEYSALSRAKNKTYRMYERLMAFVQRSARRK